MKHLRILNGFVILMCIVCSCCGGNKNGEVRPSTNIDTLNKVHPGNNYKTGFAPVNGINMYYEIHGSGSPIVLIHGGGSTIRTSFGVLMPFLSRNRQVIAVEMQAHGRTSDRDSAESFDQDADDISALLKYLKIDKADILGFSNGGSTALKVAIRHPGQVNKLVAISAIYKRDGMQNGFWDFMEKGTFKDMPQVYKDEFLKIEPDEKKLLNMFRKDQQRMLGFTDWPEQDLKKIAAPSLIVVGDKDVVRTDHAVELSRLIPHARLLVLPGGHGDFFGEIMSVNSNSKVPESTAMIIEAFLDETSKK